MHTRSSLNVWILEDAIYITVQILAYSISRCLLNKFHMGYYRVTLLSFFSSCAIFICCFVKYEMFYCLFGFESLSLDSVHFFWVFFTFTGFDSLTLSIQSLFSRYHSLSFRIRFNFSKQLSEPCLLTKESSWASLKTGEKSSHLHSWFGTLKD
jgi:hypothetical protein